MTIEHTLVSLYALALHVSGLFLYLLASEFSLL